MTPAIILHVGAGGIGIVAGTIAVLVRKGERVHRAFGIVFVIAMMTMSALGAYLAVFGPQPGAGAAPPKASVTIGILTLYLVITAWATVKQKQRSVRLIHKLAFSVALGVAAILLIFGAQAASDPSASPGDYVPYFVFASFALFAAACDLKVILRGGISGAQRIGRHLWRMCFAFFFATAFFFLGQQKIIPIFIQGSPILVAIAIAPLVLMIFWIVRIRRRSGNSRPTR
jgi:uncharacterized membrane protein